MKKYLSIIISLVVVIGTFFYVQNLKNSQKKESTQKIDLGNFQQERSCGRHPNFLTKLKISSPIAIDLSQQKYKGLAFLHGRGLTQALHLKTWEKFDHFSTYALDPHGNIYLTPMPYISIKEKTFEFQKNIYRLNSNSGNLEIWMRLDDVKAGANNPYGIIALVYECDDDSLWVSAIDETDYRHNRGVIYHIDTASKKILQKIEGIDALSLKLLKTNKGKFLLVGMARRAVLNAYWIKNQKMLAKPLTLLNLAEANERIRKIILYAKNSLKLQTIPFAYSLVAQTQEESMRKNYILTWDKNLKAWQLLKQ